MGMHKLTAGSGYDYLTRQVARNDAAVPARTPLADYYDEKGEAPGVWLGSGLAGIDGLKAGDVVTAEQMESLFGKGLHPLAAERLAPLGPDATEQQRRDAVRLGRPYRQPDTSTSLFRHELSPALRGLERRATATSRPRSSPTRSGRSCAPTWPSSGSSRWSTGRRTRASCRASSPACRDRRPLRCRATTSRSRR